MDGYGVSILMQTPGGKVPVKRGNEVKNENPKTRSCFPISIRSIAKNYNNTTTSYSLTPIFRIHCTSCISLVYETTDRFCVTRACLVVGIWGQTLCVIEGRDSSNIRIMSTKYELRNNAWHKPIHNLHPPWISIDTFPYREKSSMSSVLFTKTQSFKN